MNIVINQRQTVICSIVTTFSPNDGFPDRIFTLQEQVQAVIIVDDGATEENRTLLKGWFSGIPGIVLLHHTSNRGVAAALNTGMELAGIMGYSYVLLLDDDSLVTMGMVATLMEALANNSKGMSAIVGPSYNFLCKVVVAESGARTKEVPTIITAGTLIPIKVYYQVGRFREELFIDFVDHEYCLRARSLGVRILQCQTACMVQPIGQTQNTFWGELRSVHNQTRTYYFFRNSFAVAREYVLQFPVFVIWVIWQQFKTFVKILFFMKHKKQYVGAMIQGWSDGWARRFGRIDDGVYR